MAGAIVAVFTALAAWGWFAILRQQAPKLALAVYGVGLAVLLTIFAATFVVYVGDDAGLRRRGWFGTATLPWSEIGRYRISRRYGQLTCIFYDLSGRRRLAVNFTMLEENGQALFELLTRKLRELLPNESDEWPSFPHQEWASPDATRSRAATRVFLAATALAGLALYLGTAWGPGVWRDRQLLVHGQVAEGRAVAILEDEADRGVMYEFTTAEGARASGTVWIQRQEYPRYVQRGTVRIRYAGADPSRNSLEQLLRQRWPQDLAVVVAFSVSLLSATAMLILRRAARRPRGHSRSITP
jgi:hypothetical protein